jgi:hypothetical protein
VFITEGGEAKISQISPRRWKVLPRGGEAYVVSGKQEAIEEARGIATGLTPSHLSELQEKQRRLQSRVLAEPPKKSHAQIKRELDEVPSATLLLQRRGRYVDADAVMIGTAVGDLADSHSTVYRALRRANIEPIYLGVGSFKVTFNPNALDGEAAVTIVENALHSAGIRTHRIDLRNAK